MKIKEAGFSSQVYGAEKEMDFSIDTESSVIFDILRDKMYTNKIAAVCREVSSNSRDANTEAGRAEIPIEISIVEPFELDCVSDKSIVFGDRGNGITPDRMADVFVKYAASTKRDTNEQVGGFGLGAKTPFAYSDTFTVITVCDVTVFEEGIGGPDHEETKRMRFIYTAMIDDSQKGKMILFDSEETSEETGTKVVVPFNDNDRSDFEKEIHRATCLWKVKPELKGFYENHDPIEEIITEDTFSILNDRYGFFYATFLAVIEGIPYKLDTGLFSDEFGDFLRHGLGESYPVMIPFNTGELGISANREGIHYTDETKEIIREKLKVVVGKLQANVVDHVIGDDEDYIEACIKLGEMERRREY